MYIRSAIYKPVKIKQSLLPLAEGTVLNLAGNLASDDGSDAYGIVSQRVEVLPPSGTINVAVSGTIDLTENNVTISDNLIHGLHEFNFLPFQEVVIPAPSAGDAGKVPAVQNDLTVAWETPGIPVPTPTSDDEGKVLTAGDDGTASWQTPSGGGNQVDFVLTENDQTGLYEVTSASATFAEICAMFATGVPMATIKNEDVYLYSSKAYSDGSLVVQFEFTSFALNSSMGQAILYHYHLESYGDGWTVNYDTATISL